MTDPDPTIAAEQIVLGAAMLADDGSAVSGLSAIVSADDFAKPAHQIVWQAITAAHTVGDPTGPVAIAARLAASGELNKVGGGPYLHDLLTSVPTSATAGHYAKLVAEAAARRRASVAATRIAQAATEPGADLAAVVEAAQADLTVERSEAWAEPVALTVERSMPAFPVDVLPDWVADMVSGVAEATATPTDLAGSLSLAALATATMGRVLVEPGPGWREQTSVFTCTALDPGNRKTAVFDEVSAPIWAAEAHVVEELTPQIVEAKVEKAIAIKAGEAAVTAAGKNSDDHGAVSDAKRATLDAENIVVPAVPRFVTNDPTPEAAKTLLAQQGGRVAVLDDEGGLFAQIAGRYSGTPDLDVFLKGHAGGKLRIDRKSSEPEFVERAALTIGLAVQPEVIRDVASIPGFESRGLLARFLWSLPQSMVGYRPTSPPPLNPTIRDRWNRRVRDLAITMWHTTTDTVLTLTPDAQAAVKKLSEYCEPRLRPDGEWRPILSWANKWVGAVVRIAGLLHIAEHLSSGDGWRRPINADTIDAAAMIGYYYATHALATWDHMHASSTGPATTVLNWLTKQRQPMWKQREIWRSIRCQIRSTDELSAALQVLENHGYIRIYQPERTGRGRRPSPHIHVHPSLTKGKK
ncbi:DnaB helicase-like protein [Stackebrandtia endophytica]|uniref:DnaB helicase-like protein n=1 Tax=Stackebrandtia endophytica TaxID=1496996 RepID=A0A543AWB0_9ACTN|nr:YfjI family protein [Stackebrandtia endophytica]TQL76840.1 DnaB helicase-like protein [Stackebrandtia endophytica]